MYDREIDTGVTVYKVSLMTGIVRCCSCGKNCMTEQDIPAHDAHHEMLRRKDDGWRKQKRIAKQVARFYR